MSIADEITRIKNNISSAYDAAEEKGATLPAVKNSENLAGTIATVTVGGGGEDDIAGIIDGTLTELVIPAGVTTIAPYRFYEFNLRSVDLGSVETIGESAFYHIYCVQNVVLPTTIKNIGNSAFSGFGKESAAVIELSPTDACTIASNAFNGSGILKIGGRFTNIGSYGFANCKKLSEINIEQCGNVGDYAFSDSLGVKSVSIKVSGSIGVQAFSGFANVEFCNFKESFVTSLGVYAFKGFGKRAYSTNKNILTLDFRNSKFTLIPSECFSGVGTSATNMAKYLKLFFPYTVHAIVVNNFGYTDQCEFYFTSHNPPILSGTGCWNTATNYKIFVPYDLVNTYRTATNWAVQNPYLKGFAAENTFSQGLTFPSLTDDGYALIWYSDSNCTTAITTVENVNAIHYCVAGEEKLAYKIKNVSIAGCSIVITDGTKTYLEGDKVLIGTVLTITFTPNIQAQVPFSIKINGEDFISGNTFTMDKDLNILAIFYDGVNEPINSVLAENSWPVIYWTFRYGNPKQYWNVGDIKPVTLNDGKTYTIRIADMQPGRYALADGINSSNGVFEFVQCVEINGATSFAFNSESPLDSGSSANTAGGWAECILKNTTLDIDFWELLPDDVKKSISSIKLNEYSLSGVSPRESINKIFLPAETEILSTRFYSAEGVATGCVKYDRYDYYASSDTNNSDNLRVKYLIDTTTAYAWRLRSPFHNNYDRICVISSTGSFGWNEAKAKFGVAPIFAI